MAPDERIIWIIGEPRDDELRSALRDIELATRGGSVELFLTVRETAGRSCSGLCIALQDWSAQYSRADVNRLIEATQPAGRLLCVYGSWCESDGRTAQVWPHACWVPARNAVGRVRRELADLQRKAAPLPLTSGRDEVFEFQHAEPQARLTGQRVRIVSDDRRLRETLQAVFRHAGADVHARSDDDGVVVWAVPHTETDMARAAAPVVQGARGGRVVAVMAMPQPADWRSLQQAGVAAVVPLLTAVGQAG